MKHGRVHTDNSSGPAVPSASSNPSPATHPPDFSLPAPSCGNVNYESAFLCSLPLHKLQSRARAQTCNATALESVGVVSVMQESTEDQRHLTKVTVGVEEEEEEEEDGVSQDSESSVEEILQQVSVVYNILREF